MMGFAKRFIQDESGATALEYGLLAGLISLVVVAAATVVFNNIGAKFNKISTSLGS
jgi:pilus assembly protein Flp/PilA